MSVFDIIAYGPNGEQKSPTLPKNFFSHIVSNRRYAVILENSLDLAVILLEIYKREAISVPIMPGQLEEQKRSIIEHADVDGIIFRKHGVLIFEARFSTLKSAKNHRFLIYTSGSTGAPKGVLLSNSAVEHNARAVAKLHDFSSGAHATCLPLYHCNALMMSLIGSYLSDTKLIILTEFQADTYLNAISHHGVTTASIVPALIPKLISSSVEWPEALRYLITAAAPLTKDMAKNFYKKFGARLRQGYGLSEAVNFSFVTPKLCSDDFLKEYIWNYPPVGLPLEGYEYRISEFGEVEVKGPNVMQGYWRNEDATAAVLNEGWLKTGDIGYVREGYLVLNGRAKEIINRGGESTYPADLEERYCGLVQGESSYVVVPVQHKILDNDIGLCFDMHTGELSDVHIGNVLAILQCSFIPAVISYKRVSRTSTGKPQRLKDGRELFCYQGGYEKSLEALWELKFSHQASTDSKLNLEKLISVVVPNAYKLQLKSKGMESFNCLLQNLINDCLNFYGFHNKENLNVDIDHSFKLQKSDGSQFFFVKQLTQIDIDNLASSDLLAYVDIPNYVGGETNPFKYEIDSRDPFYFLHGLNLEKYWFSISPIRFKRYIFANLILIKKYE